MTLELIYRTSLFIQMTIHLRDNVRSFNVYESTDDITYNFLLNVANVQPQDSMNRRRFLGRCVFQFNPADIPWDSMQYNYIQIAPIDNLGVEGAKETTKIIPPLHSDQHDLVSVNKVALHAWNDTYKRYVPLQTDDDFKLKII